MLSRSTGVTGWLASWNQPGVFELAIQAIPDAGLEQAEKIMHEELAAVAEGAVTELELDKAKNGLETYFWRSTADASSRARGLGHAETTVGDFRWFFGQGKRYQAVTREQVMAAAKACSPDRLTAVIARPSSDREAV